LPVLGMLLHDLDRRGQFGFIRVNAQNAAQQAAQLFETAERQVGSVLRVLGEDERAVISALQRRRRLIENLREQGLTEEIQTNERICAEAQQRLDLAYTSKSFEDALMHLRQARSALDYG